MGRNSVLVTPGSGRVKPLEWPALNFSLHSYCWIIYYNHEKKGYDFQPMKVGLLNEFPSHYQRKIIKKTWEIIQEILRLRCKGLLKWKCLPEGIHFLWDFLIATMFCLYFHWRLISYSLLHGWGQGCLCHKQSTPLGWPGDVPQYNSLQAMSYHKWRKLLNWHFDQSWDPLWLGNNYVCRIEYCHFDQKLDNLHEKN